MKISTKVFTSIFLLFFSIQSIKSHILEGPSRIIELTHQELEVALKNKQSTCIVAYMNGCSHCKSAIEAAEALADQYPNIHFYLVNGPEKKLPEKVKTLTNGGLKIIGYPSIVFIKEEKIQMVQTGGHSKTMKENLIKYCIK